MSPCCISLLCVCILFSLSSIYIYDNGFVYEINKINYNEMREIVH